jgi:hypothetical protein
MRSSERVELGAAVRKCGLDKIAVGVAVLSVIAKHGAVAAGRTERPSIGEVRHASMRGAQLMLEHF